MSRKTLRAGLTIAATLGVLVLSGCAGNPDLTGLEGELAELEGVNGAAAYTTHSGAPWNTQVVVMLFLDDSSDAAVLASAEAAAPVLAADPTASSHEVSIAFIDGDRADYASPRDGYSDDIMITPAVTDPLGVEPTGNSFLRLLPDDIRRLAEGS